MLRPHSTSFHSWITRLTRRSARAPVSEGDLPPGHASRNNCQPRGFDKAGHVELLGDRRVGKLRSDLVPFVRQIERQLPVRGPERKILSTRVLVFVFAKVRL